MEVNRLLARIGGLVCGITLGLTLPAKAQFFPPPPAPLVITGVTATTVGLEWNDIYNNEEGFHLSRFSFIGQEAAFDFGPNVTNYVDTNLVTGMTYSYYLWALFPGTSSEYAYISATPAPLLGPEPLLITSVTANTIGLAWNDHYLNEDGFRLTRLDNLANQTVFQFGPNVTNYLDTNLVAGVNYAYQIVCLQSGEESAPAFTSATATPIAGPEPLLITGVTANTISLAWNDIYENEDGFRLRRSDNSGNSVTFYFGPNVTTYLDTNLTVGVNYYYDLVAFNSGGDSAIASNVGTTQPIPGPEPLLIAGVTANTISLTWNDIYENEDGFRLRRSNNWGNDETFYFGPNVTNYVDTNLVVGIYYYYDLVAFNSGGDSAIAFNYAITEPIPGPEPLLIAGVTGNTISLTWNDIYENEDGFRLMRSDNWGNNATFYFGPNVTSYVDTNLAVGIYYYYDLVAFNSGGNSAFAFNYAITQPIPGPEPLLIAGVTANTISLTWNDIYGNEDGFRLRRSDNWGNNATFYFGPNVTNYVDTNLVVGIFYYYDLVALNSGGDSAIAFNYAITQPIPGPEPLLITGVTANTISLAWNDIYGNEDGFRLRRSDNWGNNATFYFGPNVTTYVDTNLDVGVFYYYDVVAFNSGGDSAIAFNWAITQPIPAPEPLEITGVTGTTISLAWNDIYENEDGFRLRRSDNWGNNATFYFGPNVTTYVDTNLVVGEFYYYDIVAFNSGGDSAIAFNYAITQPIPAPEPLVAVDITTTTVDLTWSDIYTNETGFRLERATDQFPAFTTIAVLGTNTTAYHDSGLQMASQYFYRVAALTPDGDSDYAGTTVNTEPTIPAAPSELMTSSPSQSTLTLTWSDNSANETGFQIERGTTMLNFAVVATVGANVSSYTDSGLNSGTLYLYRVSAFNARGFSAPSEVGTGTTTAAIPAAPSGLLATAASTSQINVFWTDNSTNESGFRIYISTNGVDFTVLAEVSQFQAWFPSAGLNQSTTYYYRVAAFNSGGEVFAAGIATATTLPFMPATPSGLTATANSQTQITLNWTDNSTNETGFRIERSLDGTNFTVLTTVAANATSFQNPGLISGTRYYYRVSSFNAGGTSSPSNIANAKTTDYIPDSPSNLTATALSAFEIQLSWTDNSTNETGFRIYVSTDGGTNFFLSGIANVINLTTYTQSNTVQGYTFYFRVHSHNSAGDSPPSNIAWATTPNDPPPAPSGLIATTVSTSRIDLSWTDNATNETGYRIWRSLDGTNMNFMATVGSNVTTFANTGLAQNTQYYYQVATFNNGGYSTVVSATAATSGPFPPAAPSGLSASTVSASRIDLSWTDNANNEMGFKIYISTNGTSFTVLTNVPANVTTCSSAGLIPATTYYYRVSSFNSPGGESASSGTAIASTLPNPPAAPSGLSAITVSQTQINLAWTDNANNETGFKIYISTDGANFTVLASLGENVTTCSSIGLNPAATYYYKVTALNSGGESSPSAIASASTLPNPPAAPSSTSATAVSQTQITVSWSDNSANETGFRIERSLDGLNFSLLTTVGANVTSYADSGLNPLTTYCYRISAFNTGGTSAASNVGSAITPDYAPAAPSALSATGVSQTQIDLAWTDNANNETGFKISISTDGTNFTALANLGANVTTYSSTGLNPATTYYYQVSALNSGGESSPSAVASTSTLPNPPAVPSGLSATTVSQTQINLAWTDNANNETGFKIYISVDGTNFTPLATLGANVTTYSSTGLNPAATYYYQVSALNSGGESSLSAIASASTLPNPPAVPSGLSATTVSQTQINLAWTDNANNETGFKVYRSTDGINFNLLTNLAANVTTYLSFGLSPATTYYYRVTAVNSGGESSPSTVASASTLPNPPAAPSALTATAVSQTQINLAWTDNANNETGFRIERSLDGVSFTLLTNVAANVASYADAGRNPVTTYYYRVSAFNAGGTSAASNIASATTPDYAPAAPSGLSASAVSATQINLAWTDNANNETGFKVYRSTDGINFTLHTNLAANVTTYSNTGLTPATTYSYRVTASNATGESAASNIASATTLAVPPVAPSGLTATAVSSNRVDLSWTDNASNETGYQIERSTNGVNFTQIATVGANVTTYTNTGLAASTLYYYRVRATNAAGNSAYSSTASATTGPSAPPAAPSNLTLTVVSSSRIDLQWNDNSSNETQFLIERSLNGTTFTQIATVSANVHNYSATGLQSFTRYYFRVRATNSVGNSAYSNTANAKTLH